MPLALPERFPQVTGGHRVGDAQETSQATIPRMESTPDRSRAEGKVNKMKWDFASLGAVSWFQISKTHTQYVFSLMYVCGENPHDQRRWVCTTFPGRAVQVQGGEEAQSQGTDTKSHKFGQVPLYQIKLNCDQG